MSNNRSYEHSQTFDVMKGINEQVVGNLTSLQYLQTLDLFLWNALMPIHAECPSLFNNYLVKIVAHQSIQASTKFTSDDRSKLAVLMFNVLTNHDPRKAHEQARLMYINRGLLFGFIALFLKKLRHYERLHSPFVVMDPVVRNSELHRIEQSMGLRHNSSLYSVIQQVRHWHDKALWWKGVIVEKYTRMTLLQAKSAYEDFNHYVNLNDVVQIYLMVLNRAIDRCDARQGVLTTFIQNWYKSARSEVADLSKTQTDVSYESISEEHGDAASDILGFAKPNTEGELEEHIAYTAKTIDKRGYVRAVLGIPEYVTRQQRELLELFVLED